MAVGSTTSTIVSLAGALMACGISGIPCNTECGMTVYMPVGADGGVHPGWTCENVQRTVRIGLEQYAIWTTDPRFASACERLQGYQFEVKSLTGGFPNLNVVGRPLVGGLSYCWEKRIEINGVEPWRSSIVHEMAHAIQDCRPDGYESKDPTHSNWIRDGIVVAYEQAKLIGAKEMGDGGL